MPDEDQRPSARRRGIAACAVHASDSSARHPALGRGRRPTPRRGLPPAGGQFLGGGNPLLVHDPGSPAAAVRPRPRPGSPAAAGTRRRGSGPRGHLAGQVAGELLAGVGQQPAGALQQMPGGGDQLVGQPAQLELGGPRRQRGRHRRDRLRWPSVPGCGSRSCPPSGRRTAWTSGSPRRRPARRRTRSRARSPRSRTPARAAAPGGTGSRRRRRGPPADRGRTPRPYGRGSASPWRSDSRS